LARGGQRIEFVEKQHAGPLFAGAHEHVGELLLTLAKPDADDFGHADIDEASTRLAGQRACDQGFAAARRAVQHHAATG
jgi:hypothetical protein